MNLGFLRSFDFEQKIGTIMAANWFDFDNKSVRFIVGTVSELENFQKP